MKKFCITFCLLFIIFLTVGCDVSLNGGISNQNNYDYLRIHVRANSNDEVDQTIKYIIKDKIITFLTPYVANCQTKNQATSVITQKSEQLKSIIDKILAENGLKYKSKVSVKNEKFPTRIYDGITFESGYYDVVMVELGQAKGDNWWCVVYPPLCFSSAENIVYRSKIKEIIEEFKKKHK